MATLISKTAGFNLLEMLVALLVISVGLLGVTSLQLKGQQSNQLSYVRTQVTYLAYDLMERIRANQQSRTNPATTYGASKSCDAAIAELSSNCESETCTWADIAKYDRALWCDMVKNSLPEGTGDCCEWDGTTYTFTITWREKEKTETDNGLKTYKWSIMIP